MARLAGIGVALAAIALGVAQPTGASPVYVCARADLFLFHVARGDRIAVHVRRLRPHQDVELDGPGFHRVRHANGRGRAVVHVRPRRSGRASVTVQCNDSFRVRVTEAEDGG
jgi:hypothetical protein